MKLGLMIFLTLIVVLGIEWLITCGVIKLITLCFGWTFSWSIATGIWLVLSLIQWYFKSTSKK